MPKGFFCESSLLAISDLTKETVPKCGACKLYTQCNSPKMPVSGKGKQRILIVAEAPGKDEDEQGRQLVGKSGKELQRFLRKLGIDMRTDCWLTNALICRPPNNRKPKESEIAFCRPNLMNTLRELDPITIIPIGGVAVQSLIGALWRENVGAATQWVGWSIPCQKLNAWIHPTYHPSYLLRSQRGELGGSHPVLERMFEQHLEAAIEHTDRPWTAIPDYDKQIDVIMESGRAAAIIRKMIAKGGTVAFDYETNMLKPDSAEASIVCCSVSWMGKKTIAFPWHGEAVQAMRELLRSPLGKIASNMKFEERWTRKVFGHGVRGWDWDTMLAAHWLDNRKGITSIKFQAFVQLGVEPWDHSIKTYLQAQSSNSPNRQTEIELDKLMLYCGKDSLFEYLVAEKQKP